MPESVSLREKADIRYQNSIFQHINHNFDSEQFGGLLWIRETDVFVQIHLRLETNPSLDKLDPRMGFLIRFLSCL